MFASTGWPWWIVPLYAFYALVHTVTYPVTVLPFRLACHVDMWGTEPPQDSCPAWWCDKAKNEWHTIDAPGWQPICNPDGTPKDQSR